MPHSRRLFARAGLLALALGASLAIAGCAGSDTTTPGDNSTGVIAPEVVDITEIDRTTVPVQVGNVIDLTGDDETYLDWTASIQDESIVGFTPGKDDGSAQFNPGLTALKVGETEVSLDNSTSGDNVTFTVKVTAE